MAFAWGEVAPYVRSTDHWPAVLVGAVFSGTPLGYGTGTLVGGWLADRVPPRRLCWAGLALLAAGLAVAFGFPSGLTFVTFYSFLALGVGGGVALTGAVAALTQVHPERSGLVGGAVTAAYAASAVFQAPLIGALIPHLGWIGSLRAVGVFSALPAVALLSIMPALPAPHRPASAGEYPASVELLARPRVWTSCLLVLCGAVLGPYAVVALGGEAIARHLGPAVATLVVVIFAVGNATGRLVAGLASDRLGTSLVMLAVLLLDLFAAALVILDARPGSLPVAGLAAGLALGGANGGMGRMSAEAAPDAPHTAFGMIFAAFAAGALVGPVLGSLAGGSRAWLVVGAPAAAGLVLLAARPRLTTCSDGLRSRS